MLSSIINKVTIMITIIIYSNIISTSGRNNQYAFTDIKGAYNL